MQKREDKLIIKNCALLQIFLLVGMGFAISFILSENVVGAGPLDDLLKEIKEKEVKTKVSVSNRPSDMTRVREQELLASLPEQEQELIKKRAVDESAVKRANTPATPKEFDLFGLKFSGGTAHLVQGFVWAGAVIGAIQLLGGLFGADKETLDALSISALGGIMTWKGISSLGPTGFGKLGAESFLIKNAPLIGIGVAVAIFVLTYKKESKQVMTFECQPWEPQLGGGVC